MTLTAREVAMKCLDILCTSLHQAEAEGYILPQCIDDAWKKVTDLEHAATLPPEPAAGPEGAWLVERTVDGCAAWWTGAHSDHFDHDPNQAVRFCRREDAFWVARTHIQRPYELTEHIFLDALPPEPAAVPEGWEPELSVRQLEYALNYLSIDSKMDMPDHQLAAMIMTHGVAAPKPEGK